MAEGKNATLLTYVREKEEAREEVKRVEQELAATKSKLYDAVQKIDELKDKVGYGRRSRERNQKKTAEGRIRAMQEDINIEYDSKAK